MENISPTDISIAAEYASFLNELTKGKQRGGRCFAARLVRITKTHLIFQNRSGLTWAYAPDALEYLAVQREVV
jgi:hypothetical protein